MFIKVLYTAQCTRRESPVLHYLLIFDGHHLDEFTGILCPIAKHSRRKQTSRVFIVLFDITMQFGSASCVARTTPVPHTTANQTVIPTRLWQAVSRIYRSTHG